MWFTMKGHPRISSVAQLRLYGLSKKLHNETMQFNSGYIFLNTKKVKFAIYHMKSASESDMKYFVNFFTKFYTKIT